MTASWTQPTVYIVYKCYFPPAGDPDSVWMTAQSHGVSLDLRGDHICFTIDSRNPWASQFFLLYSHLFLRVEPEYWIL